MISRSGHHGISRTISVVLLSCAVTAPLLGQTITLRGTVQDKFSGTPLSGALIEIIDPADTAVHFTTQTDVSGSWSYAIQSTHVHDGRDIPASPALLQNYPNPFNPSTTIGFSVPSPGRVTVTVHNLLGQELDARTEYAAAGMYSIEWTGIGAAGVLFYSIETGGVRLTRKMVQLDGSGNGGLGPMRFVQPVTAPASVQSRGAAEYLVIASKLGYFTDSTLVPAVDNARADFLLESVHHAAFVIDLHNDVLDKVVGGYQLGVRHSFNHSDLPRFREGGVDAQMFVAWPNPNTYGGASYARALQMIAAFDTQVVLNAAELGKARNLAEVDSIVVEGKLAGVLVIEGGHAIEDDLSKLIALYERGARYMTITWNNSTSWAVSAQDQRSATVGLSDFGRQVIRTMDSLGMIIDVSHTGIKTIEDILATTVNPVIASHSGVRALRDHYRNLTDDQIRRVAQSGGVIGVVFYPWFLSSSGSASIQTVIQHIDYIRDLVGVEYIAIGSDFDGIEVVPFGLEDVSRLPALTLALLEKGYSLDDVRKILGENFRRVFKRVCG